MVLKCLAAKSVRCTCACLCVCVRARACVARVGAAGEPSSLSPLAGAFLPRFACHQPPTHANTHTPSGAGRGDQRCCVSVCARTPRAPGSPPPPVQKRPPGLLQARPRTARQQPVMWGVAADTPQQHHAGPPPSAHLVLQLPFHHHAMCPLVALCAGHARHHATTHTLTPPPRRDRAAHGLTSSGRRSAGAWECGGPARGGGWGTRSAAVYVAHAPQGSTHALSD